MSTATHAERETVAGIINADRMERLLDERSAARELFDKVASAPRSAASWIMAKAEASGLASYASRGYSATKSKIGWALGVVRTAGVFELSVLSLTSPSGRSGISKVAGFAGRVAAAPFKLLGKPLGWLSRHTGSPGRKVAETFDSATSWVARTTVRTATRIDGWLARHDAHMVVLALRSVCRARVIRSLITRFVPNKFVWRAGAYLAVYALLPNRDEERLVRDTLKGVTDKADAAVAPSADGTVDSFTQETGSGVLSASERVLDLAEAFIAVNPLYSPDENANEVIVANAAGTPTPVRIHRMADGSTVYETPTKLFHGHLPADVDPAGIAEQIAVASEQMTLNDTASDRFTPDYPNRAARRHERRSNRGRHADSPAQA